MSEPDNNAPKDNVRKDKVVSFDYTLTDPQGRVIDTSKGRGPLTYLYGSGGLIPGMERALEGRSRGDSFQVVLSPDDGYGQKDPRMVQSVPRSAFGGIERVEPGMQFQARTPQGAQVVTVVGVQGDEVTIDGNHPLAGVTLHFDVNVTEVRDATPEEVQHGHAHGAGGHQH